jgi:hypothetical protein
MYQQYMEQNNIYEINGYLVKINKDKFESNKMYSERVLYIINNLKKYKKTIDIKDNLMEQIRLSRIYVNQKFLHCKYSLTA